MHIQSNWSFGDRLSNNICISFYKYITNLDAYELHLGEGNVFNDFINECQGFALHTW